MITEMAMQGVSLSHGPDLARLFMMFLVLVSVITAVRVTRLTWYLFWPGGWRQLPSEQVFHGTVSADRLAKVALARAMAINLPSEGHRNSGDRTKAINRDVALQTLRLADARFRYLWRLSQGRVVATRTLTQLTLLVSVFATIAAIEPTFAWEVSERNITAAAGAYETGKALANRLAVGLLVCAVMWALAMVFQGLLHRRMVSWRYFHAVAIDVLSNH